MVCGAGMVVGAWRGRALWLIVPGLLFAGSGFVAGHAARAGIDEFEAGTRHLMVDSAGRVALPAGEQLIAGEIEVTLYSAPPDDLHADLRVGLGVIDIVVDDDVTIDVRAHVHDGDIVVNGVERSNDGDIQVIRVGSGERAEAVVSVTVSVGRLEITQHALPERVFRAGDESFRN